MEILNKTSKIAAMLLLCHSFSYAGWKTVADSQVAIQTSEASSLKTSLTSSYAGGSARVQWRNLGTLNVINMTAPTASVGCNGIEIGFGSVSFLDFDNLVNKLKMVAAQAPAFAFKMAIDTACSQCSTIMQDLEDTVEAINNFSLDSCAIAENLGSSIGSSLANASESRYADSYEAQKQKNTNNTLFNKNKIIDTVNSWNDTVNGKSLKLEQLKGYGSFLNNLRINKISSLNGLDPKEFIEIIRTLVGDVVGYMDAENNFEDTYKPIAPSGSNINDLVAMFIGEKNGTDVVFYKTRIELHNNDSTWDEVSLSSMPTGYNVSTVASDLKFDDTATGSDGDSSGNGNTRSWTYNIRKSINSVVAKIKEDRTLTSQDYEYMQNLPYNGYKIVNLYGTLPSTSSAAISIDDYAKYVALANAKIQLDMLLNLASKSIAEHLNELKITPKKDAADAYRKLLENVQKQKEFLDNNKKINELLYAYENKIREFIRSDRKENRQERIQN